MEANQLTKIGDYKKNSDKESNYLKEKNLKQLLSIFGNRLNQVGIPYLVHLHHKKFLIDAIKCGIEEQQNGIVYKQFKHIYTIIDEIFPKFFKLMAWETKKQFDNLLGKQSYKQMKISEDQFKHPDKQQNRQWQQLMNGYFEIRENFIIHSFNEFITKKLLPFKLSKNTEDIICINWLKVQLEEFRKNSKDICCRLYFEDGQIIHALQSKNTEFKKYFWPVNSPNIEFHIKKTIVGFLNAAGGIIYIGIQENKQKTLVVSSIQLEKNQLGQVYRFFKNLVKNNIFPTHPGFEELKQEVDVIENRQLPINDYVTIEFMPILDSATLLPVEKKYMVKIFVKIGHPKHLYHLINNDNMIDFFMRDDRNVQKKPFPDAYKMIYDKLDAFEVYKKEKINKFSRPTFHNDCRYKMDGIIIDIDQSDDESD